MSRRRRHLFRLRLENETADDGTKTVSRSQAGIATAPCRGNTGCGTRLRHDERLRWNLLCDRRGGLVICTIRRRTPHGDKGSYRWGRSTMSSFRTEVESYVKGFWDIPCDDNTVESINYTGLKQAKLAELTRAGENPANWRAVFLRNNTYDSGTPQCPSGCAAEELYLVRSTFTRDVLKTIQYDQARVPAGDKDRKS